MSTKKPLQELDKCPLGPLGAVGVGTRGCLGRAKRWGHARCRGTKGLILVARLNPQEGWVLEAGAEAEGPTGGSPKTV